MSAADQSFFDETTSQSIVKSTIVGKYFTAWARVIKPTVKRRGRRLAYIDLFSGPGRYEDGTKSTPVRVIESAIADPDLCDMLVTIFNDKDESNCALLQTALIEIDGIGKLRYPPRILNTTVAEELVEQFSSMEFVPTLFFIDPWGYKGLSLQLINAVLKDWGCDCVFFFNYTRINMGITNPFVQDHMRDLFGGDTFDELADAISGLDPENRELAIVESLCAALAIATGAQRYVLPFRFRNDQGTRTKHHLIFVSKHPRGYEIMKEIMAGESSKKTQGVASFEYSPADQRYPTLFGLTQPLDQLSATLAARFAGQSMTMNEVYLQHNVGTPYVKSNYKEALAQLEEQNRIVATPPASDRPTRQGKMTFADHVLVTFPEEESH
jgi:three-Cys-motif partner protein